MFGLDFLAALDPSALTTAAGKTALTDADCSGYCVDNSADYVGFGSDGSNNLLGDGKIYPAQEANVGQPQMLSDSSECSYFSCDHSADYVGTGSNGETNLTGDGVIFPKYQSFAAADQPQMLSDSSECSYFSCDHSADYVGTGSNGETNLTGDGVIFPKYQSFAVADQPQMLSDSTECSYYSCDHSADYIGTVSNGADNHLTSDGTIYPIQEQAPADSAQLACTGYDCDNSADYIGTPPEGLTGDGVIYPEYTPLSGAVAHGTTALVEEANHSGAFYCPDAQAIGVDCPTEVEDPVLIPIKYPVIAAAQTTGGTQLADAPVHDGAYYCTEPEASCGTAVVDPVLKPIQYPVFPELAPPAAAVTPETVHNKDVKPTRSSPGHLLLMGHACLFGAAEATSKLAEGLLSGRSDALSAWKADFSASSAKAATAVSPAGAAVLDKVIGAK